MADRYIIVKNVELDSADKYSGADHDDQYETIGTEEGLGVPIGVMPLEADEVEFIRGLPQVTEVFPDRPISIPAPIDSYADVHTESADDAFRFHDVLDEHQNNIRGHGATVAVLDTGIDSSHISKGQFDLALARDFTGGNDYYDRQGHGSWCAGAICSEEYGFAPEARLIVGKVLDDSGSGMYSWIIGGVNWALENGANVASMSLGGGGEKESPLNLAVNNAYLRGMNVIVAAGNEQRGKINRVADETNPASARYATTVAACNLEGVLAPFSNWGYCVDIMALGVNAEGLGLAGEFGRRMSGTSMATPYVAGGFALLRGAGYTAAGAKNKLYQSARNSREYGAIKEGHGILRTKGA